MERRLEIEGYTVEELSSLDPEALSAVAVTGEPVVFRAGSAEVLGEFRVSGSKLVVELAHIDGGGEGVLQALASVAESHARRSGLSAVEWIVYATRCAAPNPKLQRVLVRRGFEIRDHPERGECFHQLREMSSEKEKRP